MNVVFCELAGTTPALLCLYVQKPTLTIVVETNVLMSISTFLSLIVLKLTNSTPGNFALLA